MRALLMHRDRDLDVRAPMPWNEPDLVRDLALQTLVAGMAGDDALIRDVAHRVILTACDNDVTTIRYRQATIRDALNNPQVVRELYAVAVDAIEQRRRGVLGVWGRSPSSVLYGALDVMRVYVARLRRLRAIAHAHMARFTSEGFRALFAMLERELTDDYLAEVEAHLADLTFRHGTLLSAELGPDAAGRSHALRDRGHDNRPWLVRLLGMQQAQYSFRIPERDVAGMRLLSELRDRGIDRAANALGQSADHVDAFFHMLRAELAFVVGSVNLHERLTALEVPTCFPQPLPGGSACLGSRRLSDPSLALASGQRVVGNTVTADAKSLVIVTGANQGGKSVFLRSLGIAQLMMQSGTFVAAEAFAGAMCPGLATHYRREEDATLASGKFDEELDRMSTIVDHLTPNTLLLFNESFAATNEREGAEIAHQIISTVVEKGMRVVFVTHLYAFARAAFEQHLEYALFLRAERSPDGPRTFRIIEGEPYATSYGRDLYDRIFSASMGGRGGRWT